MAWNGSTVLAAAAAARAAPLQEGGRYFGRLPAVSQGRIPFVTPPKTRQVANFTDIFRYYKCVRLHASQLWKGVFLYAYRSTFTLMGGPGRVGKSPADPARSSSASTAPSK